MYLVQVEIANRLAGVWGFFGLLDRLLELLFQKISRMFLRFHRLPEDGFAAAVLLLHGLGSCLEVVKHPGLDRGSMGDDALGRRIDLQHRAAARARNVEGRRILRHTGNHSANAPALTEKLMGLDLDGKDMEDGEHFPAQEYHGNHGDSDRQNLPKLKVTAARLEAPRDQAQNIQGGEAKDQHPENVVDVVFFTGLIGQM